MKEIEQPSPDQKYLGMDPETEAREATWNLYTDDSPECQKAIALLQENGVKFKITQRDMSQSLVRGPYLIAEPLNGYTYEGLRGINIFIERGLDTKLRDWIRWLLENGTEIDRGLHDEVVEDDLEWLKLEYLKRNTTSIRERIRELSKK